MIITTIFGISCAVVLTLYVSVRHIELPFYFYMYFPYTGVTLILIVFWISYNIVCILRHSEDVLNRLLDCEAEHLRSMTMKTQRMIIMKRAKALRGVNFPMEPFAEFSAMFVKASGGNAEPTCLSPLVLNFMVVFTLSFEHLG